MEGVVSPIYLIIYLIIPSLKKLLTWNWIDAWSSSFYRNFRKIFSVRSRFDGFFYKHSGIQISQFVLWKADRWAITSNVFHIPLDNINLLCIPNFNKIHPLWQQLQLIACRLSGQISKVTNFPKTFKYSLWVLKET